MPSPLEILLDPLTLSALGLYACLMIWEAVAPARTLPKVRGWIPRAMGVFTLYFFASSYLPMAWDKYLAQYQLFDLSHLGAVQGMLVGLVIYEVLLYAWHRAMHEKKVLWRSFHQMHHSAERLDTFGAFYLSPMDTIGFTFLGSLALVLLVGLSPQAVTLWFFVTLFFAVFQHANINTPRWLGYFIQRPESHSVHHERGWHRHNYADLPVIDMLFGTFRNPKGYEQENGFYQGASGRILDMLLWRDVSKPKQVDRASGVQEHKVTA